MKNDGGQAFPIDCSNTVDSVAYEGMTLRDYFAGQALAGLCVSEGMDSNHGTYTNSAREFAYRAYIIADAMLKAREEA